ncbi:MAG TPA: DUF423 domain-containing protein [Flavobacterium sp.]|jgi:uncharacterized membrane protein YgdD (TMEM256/DUF423 family)
MDRKLILTGILLGVIAIVLGAFGAHALKDHLDVQQLATFETGVRYQMYHAFFLLFIGLSNTISPKRKQTILWLVVAGVVLFSGSIYLLATQSATQINFKPIGFVTPIGGLLLIISWILLFADIAGKKS